MLEKLARQATVPEPSVSVDLNQECSSAHRQTSKQAQQKQAQPIMMRTRRGNDCEDASNNTSREEDEDENEEDADEHAKRTAEWSKLVDERNQKHEEEERELAEQRDKDRAAAVARVMAKKEAATAAATAVGDSGSIGEEVSAKILWEITDGMLDTDVDAILEALGHDSRFTPAQVRVALIEANCNVNEAYSILTDRRKRIVAASMSTLPATEPTHSFTSDEDKEELLCDEISNVLSDKQELLDAAFSQLRGSANPFQTATAIRAALPPDLRQRSQRILRVWAKREAIEQQARQEKNEQRKHELALMHFAPTTKRPRLSSSSNDQFNCDQVDEFDETKQYGDDARRGACSIQCESTNDQSTVNDENDDDEEEWNEIDNKINDGEPMNKRQLADAHFEENYIAARQRKSKRERERNPSLTQQHPERSAQRNQRVRQRRKTQPRTTKRKRRNSVEVKRSRRVSTIAHLTSVV